MATHEGRSSRDFIREIIDEHNRTGRWGTTPDGRPRVHTRFPPEPNGYLHIGHAKSICLNFGLAVEYGGKCNLRFDDTNPVKEEEEYVASIIRDVRWLGFAWPGARADDPKAGVLFASDYFGQMYAWALELIRKGRAYVDDQNAEQIRRSRGTLTRPGVNSPFRDRPIEENLALFERMKAGEFPDGSKVLRARIDMAHPNLNLRDPVMYRILHARHHRADDAWCVYPMYDWAHGFEDSIEGITHSICTLEFENHRPLYDWFIDAVNEGRSDDGSGPWGRAIHHPQQIEFARLNLNYTVMSKRRLLELVREKHVRGWDDPRMPTISGFRRRGYTPEAIRDFCGRVGVAKFQGVNDVGLLEHCLREDLNRRAPRAMCVLRPLKVVIENYPEDRSEELDAINNPEDSSAGTRKVPFARELYIEQDDFREEPPPKFWRLFPGNEVRLRYAYFVRCTGVVKNDAGEVVEVRCTYDPATRGGDAPDGRKVKSTLHWVSARHALDVEVRLYEHLFTKPDPDEVETVDAVTGELDRGAGGPGKVSAGSTPAATTGAAESAAAAAAAAMAATAAAADWKSNLNPNSLEILSGCRLEPNWDAARGPEWGDGIRRMQFERHGYFCVDADSGDGQANPQAQRLIFNRAVTLKDTWAKVARRG